MTRAELLYFSKIKDYGCLFALSNKIQDSGLLFIEEYLDGKASREDFNGRMNVAWEMAALDWVYRIASYRGESC